MKIKANNNKLQSSIYNYKGAKVCEEENQDHKFKRHRQFKKELFIDDPWKKISTKVRSPSAILRNSEKRILSVDKTLSPGPGSYDLDNLGNKRFILSKKAKSSNLKDSTIFVRSNTDNPTSNAVRTSQKSSRASLNVRKIYADEKQQAGQLYANGKNLGVPGITQIYMRVRFPRQSRKNLQKIQNKDKISSPGPSYYQSPQRKSSKNLYSFYRSKKYLNGSKQLQQKSVIPAPGQYNLSENRKLLKACRFTQAVRLVTEPSSLMNPGPGAYIKEESTLSRKGGTIGKSFQVSKTQDITPGPGFYKQIDLKSIKSRPIAVTIGKTLSQSSQRNKQKIRHSYNPQQDCTNSPDSPLRFSHNISKSLNRYEAPNSSFKISKSHKKELCQQIREINGSNICNNQRLSNHMKPFSNIGKRDRRQINKTCIN